LLPLALSPFTDIGHSCPGYLRDPFGLGLAYYQAWFAIHSLLSLPPPFADLLLGLHFHYKNGICIFSEMLGSPQATQHYNTKDHTLHRCLVFCNELSDFLDMKQTF
jgi:hypothetical protein